VSGQEAVFPPHSEAVQSAWVDYNGHMNVAYYVLIFDHATDEALDHLDLGSAYRARAACSVFVGEMRVGYRREVLAGERVTVTTHLVDADHRRLLLYHQMTSDAGEGVVADNEVLCAHVDLSARRPSPWPLAAQQRLSRHVAAFAASGTRTAIEPRLGRRIALPDAPSSVPPAGAGE